MDELKPIVPIGQIRERVIQQLTDAFANDVITLDELEARLDRVYRAQTQADAEALVAGIQPAPQKGDTRVAVRSDDAPRDGSPIHDRMVSVMSSSARRGPWSVPHQLDVVGVFSDTVIDLTAAVLPRDIIDLHIRVIAASLKIVVPPGLRVVNRVGAFMASVESETSLDLAPMIPGSPVIRITGTAFMASVEIVAGAALGESSD